MHFLYLLKVETKRIFCSKITYLLIGLSGIAPLFGYVFDTTVYASTKAAIYIGNPLLLGAVIGSVLFAMFTLYELNKVEKNEISSLTDTMVSPLNREICKTLAIIFVAILTTIIIMLTQLPYIVIKTEEFFNLDTFLTLSIWGLCTNLCFGVLIASTFYHFFKRVDISFIAFILLLIFSYSEFITDDFILRWVNPMINLLSDVYGNDRVFKKVIYSKIFWILIFGALWILSILSIRRYGKGFVKSFFGNSKHNILPLALSLVMIGSAVAMYVYQPFIDHSGLDWQESHDYERNNNVVLYSQNGDTHFDTKRGTQFSKVTYTIENITNDEQIIELSINPGFKIKSATLNNVDVAYMDLNNDKGGHKIIEINIPKAQNGNLIIHYEGYWQRANYFKQWQTQYYISDEYINPGYSTVFIPHLFIDMDRYRDFFNAIPINNERYTIILKYGNGDYSISGIQIYGQSLSARITGPGTANKEFNKDLMNLIEQAENMDNTQDDQFLRDFVNQQQITVAFYHPDIMDLVTYSYERNDIMSMRGVDASSFANPNMFVDMGFSNFNEPIANDVDTIVTNISTSYRVPKLVIDENLYSLRMTGLSIKNEKLDNDIEKLITQVESADLTQVNKLLTQFVSQQEITIELHDTTEGRISIFNNSTDHTTFTKQTAQENDSIATTTALLIQEEFVTMTLPEHMTLVTPTGEAPKVISENSDGTKTWRATAYGWVYASNYAVHTFEYDEMDLEFYYSSQYEEMIKTSGIIEMIDATMDYCITAFGSLQSNEVLPYRFLQAPESAGGGTSRGFSYAAESAYVAENLDNPLKGATAAELIAHELIHQWWGLRFRFSSGAWSGWSPEASDPEWSDEGMTTYTTYRFMKQLKGEEYAQKYYVDVWEERTENLQRSFYYQNPEYLDILPEKYRLNILTDRRDIEWYCIMPLKLLKAEQLLGSEQTFDKAVMDAVDLARETRDPLSYDHFLTATGLTREDLSGSFQS